MMEQLINKMPDAAERFLLKLEDVADILHLPINRVRDLANTGVLPSSRIGSKLDLRFRMDDVITFMMK